MVVRWGGGTPGVAVNVGALSVGWSDTRRLIHGPGAHLAQSTARCAWCEGPTSTSFAAPPSRPSAFPTSSPFALYALLYSGCFPAPDSLCSRASASPAPLRRSSAVPLLPLCTRARARAQVLRLTVVVNSRASHLCTGLPPFVVVENGGRRPPPLVYTRPSVSSAPRATLRAALCPVRRG